MSARLQLGVLNFMPHAGAYGRSIEAALQGARALVDLHPIRLCSHAYRSSADTVAAYPTYEELVARVPLDLLLVTGAPVEHLPFADIHYFPELCSIFRQAERRQTAVMGLCFGALALAKYLGYDKRVMRDKVFGVYEVQAQAGAERYLAAGRSSLQLPLSTWALLDDLALAPVGARKVKPLLSHPALGHLMLATEDERLVMMLGHPEYTASTLYQEWQRDRGDPANAYTRAFQAESFPQLARLLEQDSSPILSNWIRSHAATAAQAA